jgi:hypothetical protein
MPTGSLADGAYFMLEGRVLPAPTGKEPVWIRFQQAVEHSQFTQVKLGSEGTFRIPHPLLSGSMVVTVCRGNDVLFLDVVHFTAGKPDRPPEFRLKSAPLR